LTCLKLALALAWQRKPRQPLASFKGGECSPRPSARSFSPFTNPSIQRYSFFFDCSSISLQTANWTVARLALLPFCRSPTSALILSLATRHHGCSSQSSPAANFVLALSMFSNTTDFWEPPPLPSYVLTPRASIVPGISDTLLQLLLPIVAYWAVSLAFHALDTYDIFPQYRLHTPAEVLKRNHVSRYDVVKAVVIQQILQTATGLLIATMDPIEMTGKQAYDVAVWASRTRAAQRYLPWTLSLIGINSVKLAGRLRDQYPQIAGALVGGVYSQPLAFRGWELAVGKAIYWFLIPAVQFAIAIFIVDTWQYFLHRAMHMNKWLYTTLHSHHHRLYVPYAFGALYNHPVEGFLLDTLGAGIAYMATGMTVRQGMWFFTCSTIKTVDDHCGYAFPWDPLQHITSNNAAYHDVHHQSWGIKTNFSQPFFTFWDRFMGTVWAGGDVSARYERSRIAAQKKVEADISTTASSMVNSPAINMKKANRQAASSQRQVLEDKVEGGPEIIAEEVAEEKDVVQRRPKLTRRKTGSIDPKGDSLRSLRDRVAGSLHGRSTAILHADGVH
jgi:sphinganine C4-monooxygenase